jgi:hypothetical protein
MLPYDMAARGSTVYVVDGLRYQVLRFDLRTRRLAVVAGTGRTGTSGDGGPAMRARLTEPTKLVLDRAGNLYFSARQAFKVVLGPAGTLFLLAGDPSGGTVTQVDAAGAVLRVIGTGKLSRHVDRVPIGRVGFLPSDVEPVAGALLITETQPIPAVRRLADRSTILTTLLR